MVCFPYAIMLPGRKSAFLAGFWPDCYRESTESTEVYSMDYNTLGQHFVHAVFFLIRAHTGRKACNTRFGISAMFAALHKALIANSRSFADWACEARTSWQCTLEAMRKPGNASSNDASSRGSAAATSAEFCEPRTHFRTFKRQLLSQRRLRVRVMNELFATTRVGR